MTSSLLTFEPECVFFSFRIYQMIYRSDELDVSRFMLQISVQLVPKEWHFSDDSKSIGQMFSQPSMGSYPSFNLSTGKRFKVSVKEARNLIVKSGAKCDLYVKLQYGKVGFILCEITAEIDSQ